VNNQGTIYVDAVNIDAIRLRQMKEPFFLNGLRYPSGTHPNHQEARLHDEIAFTHNDDSIVDMVARLEGADEQPPTDVYLVVSCFNPQHRHVNDLLSPDPKCVWCKGLGLVRVLRDHVPVVRRVDTGWESAPTIVDQIGDLNGR